ncbi:hypothetical protein L3V79_02610 [Thiotrichales bacterium 19S9-12]|nr:hypothetical protein [Thiotrichales bacterium 19S9-11]MCF6811250.1 hypothetical protein [Thiotrichales bacterium 19S9-12]
MVKAKKDQILDREEKEIKKELKQGKYASLTGNELKKTKAMLKEKAKETIDKARKPISFKPDPLVLSEFKKKAETEGLPYQTLLNFLMKQYVEGNFKLKLTQSKKV